MFHACFGSKIAETALMDISFSSCKKQPSLYLLDGLQVALFGLQVGRTSCKLQSMVLVELQVTILAKPTCDVHRDTFVGHRRRMLTVGLMIVFRIERCLLARLSKRSLTDEVRAGNAGSITASTAVEHSPFRQSRHQRRATLAMYRLKSI